MRLRGTPASAGVAIAPARVLERDWARLSYARIEASEVAAELSRFEDAVARSRDEIETAKQALTQQHGATYAPILDVYLLMHGDALLVDAVADSIRSNRINAEWAIARVTARLRAPLVRNASPYFQERAQDIDHVKDHLLRQLAGGPRIQLDSAEPVVLIANDLAPADAVHLLAPPTVGLVTEVGAASSHTAILARTFGVPMVVGTGSRAFEIVDGEEVLVDGFSGEVAAGFTDRERRETESRRDRFLAFFQGEREVGGAVTEDGVDIEVNANIGLPTEIEAALESRAEGIGLCRTELMCLDRAMPPSEDEQAEIYTSIVAAMAPKRVIFRTFDWRADKRLRVGDLGQREPGWLKTQIKAVLRASLHGDVSLMFPMVGTVQQLLDGRELVEEARAELTDGSTRSASVPIGMMVEVPSAAVLAEQFARHADFFAVGTNDLAHYTLASPRGEAQPGVTALDPAVLHLVATTTAAADRAGIPCSLCGDIAANPIALGLVVGLGFRAISVPVTVVPLARAVIRKIDLGLAAQVAADALACATAEEVEALIAERLGPRLDPLWERNDKV
jgi:phosphotransferase system enzyme I (PtsI)